MTDESQVQVSPEQLSLVRTALFKTVHADYIKFINSLRELPIEQSAFHQAYIQFDTGILWAKEAISYGNLVQPAPLPEAEASAEVVLDHCVEQAVAESQEAVA